MDLILLALVVLVVLAVVVRTAQVAARPERGSGHGDEPPDTTSDRFYRGADRPAGPDAEDPASARSLNAPLGPDVGHAEQAR